MQADVKFWVEIIAAFTMPVSIIAVVWNRVKTNKGLGTSSLRFFVVAGLLPVLLILGLENRLDSGAISSLLGAIVGYLFSTASQQKNLKAEA